MQVHVFNVNSTTEINKLLVNQFWRNSKIDSDVTRVGSKQINILEIYNY